MEKYKKRRKMIWAIYVLFGLCIILIAGISLLTLISVPGETSFDFEKQEQDDQKTLPSQEQIFEEISKIQGFLDDENKKASDEDVKQQVEVLKGYDKLKIWSTAYAAYIS